MSFKLRKSNWSGKPVKSRKDIQEILNRIRASQCPSPATKPPEQEDLIVGVVAEKITPC